MLLRSLGFAIQPVDQVTALLRAGVNGKRAAIAVCYGPDESPDLGAARFSDRSPASYALTLADNEGVPYVIVAQGKLAFTQPDSASASDAASRTGDVC